MSLTPIHFQCPEEVAAVIRALPDKSCALDPRLDLPTTQLKAVADVVVPFLTELLNRSLSNGSVPGVFKEAYITPRPKKSDLDPSDTRSYRPISKFVGNVIRYWSEL